MHPEQQTFCLYVKSKYPLQFTHSKVLDVGSMDINGNNRYLFDNPHSYTGIDLGYGPNVDVVCSGHLFQSEELYDVVISTEAFEHDEHWKETIANCVKLTCPGGVFLFTCATTGRAEHGTRMNHPHDSPYTNGYYRNLTEEDVRGIKGFKKWFAEMGFRTNSSTCDLYFYGIKK